MLAMILNKIAPIGESPLEMADLPVPQPVGKQILVQVSTCGLCHTELDEIEGRLPPKLPIILGHEVVGTVKSTGPQATKFQPGDRVGSLEAHAAPGHTPGQMAYLDTRDGSLIAGDAWVTLGGVAVPGQITLFPLPAMATWHKPTALESAQALRALEPQRLAVGHGRVVEAPLAAMDRAINRAARSFS